VFEIKDLKDRFSKDKKKIKESAKARIKEIQDTA